MSSELKIFLCSLWQRTSERGNEYLSGFLGKARVIGFRGEPTADGTPTWEIYLEPGKEQREQEERRAGEQREPRAPTSSTRTGIKRWAPKAPAGKPDPDCPFFDDPVDDIGGER
jgi:hypothetical protein